MNRVSLMGGEIDGGGDSDGRAFLYARIRVSLMGGEIDGGGDSDGRAFLYMHVCMHMPPCVVIPV